MKADRRSNKAAEIKRPRAVQQVAQSELLSLSVEPCNQTRVACTVDLNAETFGCRRVERQVLPRSCRDMNAVVGRTL